MKEVPSATLLDAGASLTDLEAVEGVSSALAKKIYDFFHVSG